ncbi:hypothetical protein, partial [Corallococcus sp. 4LFB]|uniref:hypothetical protein n=1 Tax=Corallococcus sp. 4LFB TaxID=3383249 RepID=UPI00397699C6
MASPAPLPPAEADPGARLVLAEHLLACESTVACARAVVEWLARRHGAPPPVSVRATALARPC